LELPTYTNIWRIEKRLYKLYDFRLPMPLPVGQIAVFAAIAVPYVVVLKLIGLPFSHTLLWLYILPPGALAWLITRPVLEGKRLPELVVSQLRYLSEPRTWCRMAPLAEKEEITVIARVWRQADVAVVGVAVVGADVAEVVGAEAAEVSGTGVTGTGVVGVGEAQAAGTRVAGDEAVSVEAAGTESAGAEVDVFPLDEAEAAGAGTVAASPSAMAAAAEASPPPAEYRPGGSALTRHLPTGPVPAWPKAPARGDRTPVPPASAPAARGVPGQAARAVPAPSVWPDPDQPARAVPAPSARETLARPGRPGAVPLAPFAPPARKVRDQPAPAASTPRVPTPIPVLPTPPAPAPPAPPVPTPIPVLPTPPAPAPPAPPVPTPIPVLPTPSSPAPLSREALAPAAQAVPAPSAPPAAPPRSRPVVTVTGNQRAERPIRMVERALGHPAERRAASWRDHVVVVPGGHRPGQPDQMQRDRTRARLPLPGGHRVVILGCTVGAGQTMTALLTGEVLADLRDDQVAALDLNPGPGSLAERARMVPALTESRPPAPSRLEVVTRDTTARDAGTPGAPRPGEDLQDVTKIFELLSARYPLTLADPGAAVVPRVLAAASQLILVSPASQDAASALATTREWLEAHGHAGLAEGAIIVLNGVSRHTMPYVEQAEALARGRCRAIVRVPWDDHLKKQEPERAAASPPGAHPARLEEPVSPAALQAYTALAGVLVAALASAPGPGRDRP
jgi:MinD-like ATPase involved in chromosome partitioning or flagellar assembly